MYHGFIDVPTFAYFDFGNTWTGSVLTDFNYRIVPLAKEEPPVLRVYVWYGIVCFDLAENDIAETFDEELSAEGYQRVIDKVNTLIGEYKTAKAAGELKA